MKERLKNFKMVLDWNILRSFLGIIWNCPHPSSFGEDRETLRQKPGHSRMVGGRFNKQRKLLTGCLKCLQEEQISAPT